MIVVFAVTGNIVQSIKREKKNFSLLCLLYSSLDLVPYPSLVYHLGLLRALWLVSIGSGSLGY
jgi:hypothetical protein